MPARICTFTREELIAHLAAIGNRINKAEGAVTIQRISKYITECADEFNLTNEEQQMFLRCIVNGSTDHKELLKLFPKED